MKAQGWALTDVGRKRSHNEDSFLCNNSLGLFAVADGMGGHLGGERASSMAVELLETEIDNVIGTESAPLPSQAANQAALDRAISTATRSIWETAQKEPDYQGMGTTLTSLLFHGQEATIAHVGDSRAYRFRDGNVEQLTDDHSWIAEQIRAGLIEPHDALASRFKNIITRSVGFEPKAEPDFVSIEVLPGDCFVLCSDGLSNHVREDELVRVLESNFYADAPGVLVDLANQGGGDDNITVVTVYVGNTETR